MFSIEMLLLICALAFVCEYIDSSLGMGYGTILSPTLIILGFPVLTVVPAILFSQASGGLAASYFHHQLRNAHFSLRTHERRISNDLQTVIWITCLGIFASVIAAFIGTKLISKTTLGTYIGVVVFAMGFILLMGYSFKYSAGKMIWVGIISAFNKGLSGGGFGPLVTGGQMVLGSEQRRAIGVTTFAEAPICIVGFLTYWSLSGIQNWEVIGALTIGAVIGGRFGAEATKKFAAILQPVIAALLLVLGSLAFLKSQNIINVPLSL